MAVAVVIAGFFWISALWLQLPYEQVQVEAGIQESKIDVIEFADGTSQTMATGGVRVVEKAGTYGFNYMDCRYRRMTIDGEERTVAFVNCQMTVGDYIFHHEPVESGTEAIWVQGGVENKDFEALIRQYDRESAFFYCDPPYFEAEGCYAVLPMNMIIMWRRRLAARLKGPGLR